MHSLSKQFLLVPGLFATSVACHTYSHDSVIAGVAPDALPSTLPHTAYTLPSSSTSTAPR
ncbi:hypothetical protein PUNSTDRAFT_131753 [Punctularia strigosozonata HHB-11173 SS5]|uniref:uncharacterized protein n=1 Tax=Punctularia strigosozonata (strain HHB-11173) TaxID=741275 RepID=UPI00044185E7|nr:uncharacterized protein PUNSTDRAFT_131753 [Punctularia strigosozonata HHB-11173 SS5]EIN11593.1 hypothetical protein PUNSTDRAFT_131753 [Punctularia strigosozonata HHB-11173 SS5]